MEFWSLLFYLLNLSNIRGVRSQGQGIKPWQERPVAPKNKGFSLEKKRKFKELLCLHICTQEELIHCQSFLRLKYVGNNWI